MGYTFKRPDPAAMERVLTRFPYSPEGAILRLAWLEGLSREEIAALTWDQVQFEDNALTLPDRTVPLAPSAEDCLRERHRLYAQRDPHVIISDRYQRPMPPESVSRLARTALDTEGQKVSLKDLRQDFVIRQLQTHDWTYAARVSGMAVSTLRGSFSQYFQERQSAAPELPPDSEYLLWRIVQQEGGSVVGLALWMGWKLQMQPGEILNLTWSQVDLDRGLLRLPDREIPMGSRLSRLLGEVRNADVKKYGNNVISALFVVCNRGNIQFVSRGFFWGGRAYRLPVRRSSPRSAMRRSSAVHWAGGRFRSSASSFRTAVP
mgnify:CR=1 FL=1